jgi:hypothetical protein
MPRGSKVLHVHAQATIFGRSDVFLWVLIDDAETRMEQRVFILKETGQLIVHFGDNYIGTAHLKDYNDDDYVLHVFEARL